VINYSGIIPADINVLRNNGINIIGVSLSKPYIDGKYSVAQAMCVCICVCLYLCQCHVNIYM